MDLKSHLSAQEIISIIETGFQIMNAKLNTLLIVIVFLLVVTINVFSRLIRELMLLFSD